MSNRDDDKIRNVVRKQYAQVATGADGCTVGCCGKEGPHDASARLGYSTKELETVPEGANMGLGCGNPQAVAALRAGQTVLDLGSGGGFDCFLAAARVGQEGYVIGVDMTPDMVEKARANLSRSDFDNVNFRLGEIENLPVADGQVDVILSNCVINLSPNKSRVFEEAFRVLKAGGRLAISDVVATRPLPDSLVKDMEAHAGCVSGAVLVSELESQLKNAGFEQIVIDVKEESREFIKDWLPGSGAEQYVASASIEATRPLHAESCCKPPCCK